MICLPSGLPRGCALVALAVPLVSVSLYTCQGAQQGCAAARTGSSLVAGASQSPAQLLVGRGPIHKQDWELAFLYCVSPHALRLDIAWGSGAVSVLVSPAGSQRLGKLLQRLVSSRCKQLRFSEHHLVCGSVADMLIYVLGEGQFFQGWTESGAVRGPAGMQATRVLFSGYMFVLWTIHSSGLCGHCQEWHRRSSPVPLGLTSGCRPWPG